MTSLQVDGCVIRQVPFPSGGAAPVQYAIADVKGKVAAPWLGLVSFEPPAHAGPCPWAPFPLVSGVARNGPLRTGCDRTLE